LPALQDVDAIAQQARAAGLPTYVTRPDPLPFTTGPIGGTSFTGFPE
jgi:hypothetical protein